MPVEEEPEVELWCAVRSAVSLLCRAMVAAASFTTLVGQAGRKKCTCVRAEQTLRAEVLGLGEVGLYSRRKHGAGAISNRVDIPS